MKLKTFKELMTAYDENKIEINDDTMAGYMIINEENGECNVYNENDDVVFSMPTYDVLKQVFDYLDIPWDKE